MVGLPVLPVGLHQVVVHMLPALFGSNEGHQLCFLPYLPSPAPEEGWEE